MHYPVHIPPFVQQIFPALTWRIETKLPEVYLTFDDGPIPEVTPQVLDMLAAAHAKASFFCVGKNVATNPDILQRAFLDGHTIGNHTYNHISGWKASKENYQAEITKTEQAIDASIVRSGKKWFRAPYGHLPPFYGYIREEFEIAMWEVLAADWDTQFTPEQCFEHVVNNWKPGSIIVLHDSLKCAERCLYVLPKLLTYFQQKGIAVKALPC